MQDILEQEPQSQENAAAGQGDTRETRETQNRSQSLHLHQTTGYR